MAVNERIADVPAEAIWAVLADAGSFGHWVVGSREIHEVRGAWPAAGSEFVHSQGFGPVVLLKDTTQVAECAPGRRLLLEVRTRPFLVAEVELTLEPLGPGRTRIRMREEPKRGLVMPASPVVDRLIHLRNVEALRRLAGMAADRAPAVPTPSAAAA